MEAAEAKQAEAEGALTKAQEDGAVNPTEHQDLTAKNQAVTDAKSPAADAVNALPEGQDKTELQGRLDAVDGIQVPDVNDTDSNGKADDVDALQRAESPIYGGNINMSGGGHVSSRIGVSDYDIQTHANSLYQITKNNPGGEHAYTAYLDPVTGNANGKLVYNMTGDDDKIISTSQSLGNLRTVFVDNIKNLELNSGNGDDVFVIGRDTGIKKWSGETVTVNTGGGDDIFIAGAGNSEHKVVASNDGTLRLENSDYSAHNGEHIFNFSAYGTSGGQLIQTGIHMGDGDDVFLSMGYYGANHSIENSFIDMGAGNDTVSVYGIIADNGVNIKGGSGIDTLHHNSWALSSQSISGFEILNLGNESALKLYADYLTKDGGVEGNILKINGESGTSVALGHENNNTWTKGEAKSEDGVNYHVYTYSGNPDVQVWIDDDIKEVI